MPNKEDKLGALWAKSGGKGDYFTGEIEIGGVKTKIVVFSNSYKDTEKKPDFIIYKSQPKAGLAGEMNAAVSKGYNRGDSDIPF